MFAGLKSESNNCQIFKLFEWYFILKCYIQLFYSLRNIDVKWLEVPALAVNCELWNICKGEKEIDDDVLTNKLHDLLENRVLYAKVKVNL